MKIHRCFCWSLVTLRLVSVHHAGDGPQAEVLIHATEQSAPIVLPYGVRVDGTIFHTLDIDLFEFTAEAEDRVRFRITTESSTLDPRYELRDSQNGLHDSWASTAGAAGTTFQRELVLHSAGQYRISLEDRDRNDVGDYTIQFERIPPRTTERVIGYDRLVNDTIDYRLDLDAFRVELEMGKAVSIAVTTSKEGLDPDYELYDPNDQFVDRWAATSGPTGCTFVRNIVPAMSGTYTLLISDRDLDDTGDYGVFINCLTASCPPAAMEVVRNGTGVNPLAYTAVCPAVLGGVLELRIDTSSRPGATRAFVWFYGRGAAGAPSTFGEILVDPTSARLGRFPVPVVANEGLLAMPIPSNHALAGFFTSSQAAILGGGFQLTNALDITVGF